MVINKRFLLGATCALLALSAVPAWAEGEENEDGLVSQINENEPACCLRFITSSLLKIMKAR